MLKRHNSSQNMVLQYIKSVLKVIEEGVPDLLTLLGFRHDIPFFILFLSFGPEDWDWSPKKRDILPLVDPLVVTLST